MSDDPEAMAVVLEIFELLDAQRLAESINRSDDVLNDLMLFLGIGEHLLRVASESRSEKAYIRRCLDGLSKTLGKLAAHDRKWMLDALRKSRAALDSGDGNKAAGWAFRAGFYLARAFDRQLRGPRHRGGRKRGQAIAAAAAAARDDTAIYRLAKQYESSDELQDEHHTVNAFIRARLPALSRHQIRRALLRRPSKVRGS